MYSHTTPLNYRELYLYSQKAWEVVPSGVNYYVLSSAVMQNAPIVITASGFETTEPSDPWAQVNGENKYIKVGYNDFTTTPHGDIDTSKKEFALYPLASGRLIFNQNLTESVSVEYETGPSGYYIATSLDLNPTSNETDGGFIHMSQTLSPGSIHVSANKTIINADGSQFVRVTATVYDSNYDRVPGVGVIFLIADSLLGVLSPENGTVYSVDGDGYVVGVRAVTDGKGHAKAIYTPRYEQSGEAVIAAAWEGDTENVQSWVSVIQNFLVADPFVLDVSELDTWDYLA